MQMTKRAVYCPFFRVVRLSAAVGIVFSFSLAAAALRAYVADVEVRGPEWDRVEQESRDRDWERDYGDRMETDRGDVQANDTEKMS